MLHLLSMTISKLVVMKTNTDWQCRGTREQQVLIIFVAELLIYSRQQF